MQVTPRGLDPPRRVYGGGRERGGSALKPETRREFALRSLIAVSIAIGLIVLLYGLWKSAEVLLLVFAGVLLAIVLRAAIDFLFERAGITPRLAYSLVVGSLLLLLVAFFVFALPPFGASLQQLMAQLPASLRKLSERLGQYEWGHLLLEYMGANGLTAYVNGATLARLAGVFSTTLGAFISFLVILVLGIYLAAEPRLYTNGILLLLPPPARIRAENVLSELRHALLWWVLGRLGAMIILALLTWIGLLILRIPLATLLALVTGIMSFVPNIGPIISVVPALLVGFGVSPMTAVWVLLLYTLVQTTEAYLITPLIQRRAVSMPPVLVLSLQLAFTALWGLPGLIFATPLTVFCVVLVKMLYVQPVLHKPTTIP